MKEWQKRRKKRERREEVDKDKKTEDYERIDTIVFSLYGDGGSGKRRRKRL